MTSSLSCLSFVRANVGHTWPSREMRNEHSPLGTLAAREPGVGQAPLDLWCLLQAARALQVLRERGKAQDEVRMQGFRGAEILGDRRFGLCLRGHERDVVWGCSEEDAAGQGCLRLWVRAVRLRTLWDGERGLAASKNKVVALCSVFLSQEIHETLSKNSLPFFQCFLVFMTTII